MIEIVRPGIGTTFQDDGRPGFADLGVGAAGAVDRRLAALVNRLVGNHRDAAVIETIGNLVIAARAPVRVASSHGLAPVDLAQGDEFGVPPGGHGRLWHYVAVRGGFDVATVLGSRSFDTMSELGPPMPQAGDVVGVGDALDELAVVDHAPLAELASTIRVTPGPRADWFTAGSWLELLAEPWTITDASRVGVRLRGGAIERVTVDELPSEGLVRGAIQVPPDGELVMMLADHPTTGGYPVIAVVHPDDVAIAAQHSAGMSVRFRNYG
jgi:biotin-dependent carboxylase-like uncharacterized protein